MKSRFTIFVLLLGAIAALGRGPLSSDADVYRRIGQHVVVLDCSDVHCFRPLVAIVLEHLPGPSLLKWKAYAVVTIAAAALATWRLCLVMGLPARTAWLAAWLAAFGYGSLQSVFDPYTSDPLMYLLGPLMLAELMRGRRRRAGVLGTVGVLAKEFAAVPLWIYALFATLERRWVVAFRVAAAALTATLVWVALQTVLMTLFNYGYGGNPSVNLLGGGYFAVWVRALGARSAALYLFMAFGPLYILCAAGLRRADRDERLLVLAALPAVAAFVYVQQPDRALWNFHFIVVPLAAAVLATLPDRACMLFVAGFAIANLRLGETQPAWFEIVRALSLAGSVALAGVAAVRFARGARPTLPSPALPDAPMVTARSVLAVFAIEAVGFAVVGLALVDRHMHQASTGSYVNQWGYRDVARASKEAAEIRVALVGGSTAYEAALPYSSTLAGRLFLALREAGAAARQKYSVVNLAAPRAGADSYAATLDAYRYLDPDVVVFFDGYDVLSGVPPHDRSRSAVFRAAGYLPMLPARLLGRPAWMSDADGGLAPAFADTAAGDVSCDGLSKEYCAAMAGAVRAALARTPVVVVSPPAVSRREAAQQRSLAARLAGEFGGRGDFEYLDYGSAIDLSDRTRSTDGLHRTWIGNYDLGRRLAADLLAWRADGRPVLRPRGGSR